MKFLRDFLAKYIRTQKDWGFHHQLVFKQNNK